MLAFGGARGANIALMMEVLAAGFLLQDESTLLRHPEDTRDWNIFIDGRSRRDETDRFVLRFVRPQV